jgi:hypothetical protein
MMLQQIARAKSPRSTVFASFLSAIVRSRQHATPGQAAVATGDILVFVDADTMVTEQALRAAIDALRQGAVGGGAAVRFDEGRLPFYARVLEFLLPPVLRMLRLAPGCFVFCTRQAYLAAGGFDEALYVTEEVSFAQRLKRQGRVSPLPVSCGPVPRFSFFGSAFGWLSAADNQFGNVTGSNTGTGRVKRSNEGRIVPPPPDAKAIPTAGSRDTTACRGGAIWRAGMMRRCATASARC